MKKNTKRADPWGAMISCLRACRHGIQLTRSVPGTTTVRGVTGDVSYGSRPTGLLRITRLRAAP